MFSTDKRTLMSKALGTVFWKGGYASGFLKLVDEGDKSLVEYKDQRVSGRKMAVMEIHVEMGQEVRYFPGPETLSRDSRASPECMVLTWRITTGVG